MMSQTKIHVIFLVTLLMAALFLFHEAYAQKDEAKKTEIKAVTPVTEEELSLPKEPASPVEKAQQIVDSIFVDESSLKARRSPEEDAIIAAIQIDNIIEPTSDYYYAGFAKEDPMIPAYELLTAVGIQDGALVTSYEIPIVSPLQVDIRSLRVAGIWQIEDGQKKALVLTADNQGIIAKVGDPIGLSGKITKIEDDQIVTRQYSLRKDGSRQYQDLPLRLGEGDKDLLGEKIILEPGKDPKVQTDKLIAPVQRENFIDSMNNTTSGKQDLAPVNPAVTPVEGGVP